MEGRDDAGMSARASQLDLTVHVGEQLIQIYLLFVVVTGSICGSKNRTVCFSDRSWFDFCVSCEDPYSFF